MLTSNDPNTVVQIRRADNKGHTKVVKSFSNDGYHPAQNQALEWMQKTLPFSWSHAIRHEGYSVVEVHADGTERELNV